MQPMNDGGLKCRCPIHADGPVGTSFKVTPSRQGSLLWLRSKGNVLDLVAAVEGVSFHKAAILINEWLDAPEASVSAEGK